MSLCKILHLYKYRPCITMLAMAGYPISSRPVSLILGYIETPKFSHISHVVARHPSEGRGSPGVPEHQKIGVFTIHIGSCLAIPCRINVDDRGY